MRKIISLGFFFVFLVITTTVWAQTVTPAAVVNLPVQAVQASPSAVLNARSFKLLTSFMAKLKMGLTRAERISQRINTRLAKLGTSTSLSNSTDKITKLTTRQKTLAANVEQLKTDLDQLDIISQSLSSGSSLTKDYPGFKNKALVFTKNLKDFYKQESDLVVEMKKIASSSVTPSIKVVPTQ